MTTERPLFTAVSSSARQFQLLLRCISFAKKAQVRISSEGLRFSTEDGSVMEAFVFLDKSLFTTYTYRAPLPPSSQEDTPPTPTFEISLAALLETLHIFGLSDPAAAKRPGDAYDTMAAHRLNRHAGLNAFSTQNLGLTGTCAFTYHGPGHPLSIQMSESGVTTSCDLTTYETPSTEEIPFDRDALALKTITRASVLLEATHELASMDPQTLTIRAFPASRTGTHLSLAAAGALGSAAVDLTTDMPSDTPALETFQCPARTSASFRFALLKAAQRAMASAAKVSLRLDEEGVLSLQFLVEVETGSGSGSEGVAFVDFRIVPLVDGEGEVARPGDGNESEDE